MSSQPFASTYGLLWWRDTQAGSIEGFSARGWLGQFLVVDPKRRLVGVRMRDACGSDYQSPTEVDGFSEFPQMVHQLVMAS